MTPGRLVAALGLIYLIPPAPAAEAPAISAELTGALGLNVPDAPRIQWTARANEAGGRQRVAITGEGTGTRLIAEMVIDLLTGDGTWQIPEARLELASWFPAVSRRLGDVLEGFTATGIVALRGSGQRAGSVLQGTADLSLIEGALANAAKATWVEGVAVEAKLVSIAPLASAPRQPARIRAVRVGEVDIANVRTSWTLGADGRLQLDDISASMLGGIVTADSFGIAPANAEVKTVVRAAGISVEQLVKLLPPVLKEAQGHVDGEVGFSWSKGAGLEFQSGRLKLTRDEPITLRLSPVPGLITGTLNPPEIKQWQMALVKMGLMKLPTREDNPAYAPLRRVEMGETPIQITVLQAEFSGTETSGTVRLHLEGAPLDPGLKAPVLIDLNVSGPLSQLVRIGMNERFSIGPGK